MAIVVQKYGATVIGGAEALARSVAGKLQSDLSWNVEILTTTSKDHMTWTNDFNEGLESDGPIVVRRFNNTMSRCSRSLSILGRIINGMRRVGVSDQILSPLESMWVILQGPYCPSMTRYIEENKDQYDVFLFFCYLYYPTVGGLPLVHEKSIFLPLAHDEPPLRYHMFQNLLRCSRFIFANTEPESTLIKSVSKSKHENIRIAGLGYDLTLPPKRSIDLLRNFLGPQESNAKYLLFLGRIDKGKGIQNIIPFIDQWNEKHPESPLYFFLAGKVSEASDIDLSSKWVRSLGYVNTEVKECLIQNAFALVNPSEFESLSIIVFESILAATPCIVNKRSNVLTYLAQNLSAVCEYETPNEFFAAIDEITKWRASNELQDRILRSQNWIFDHYSWRKILNTYQQAAEIIQNEKK
ncbi:MAG: glycosyltransferase [Proteobacteria bacterium]|nr:glycosyltransferase [Pseudomonadota bacterium]